MQPPEQNWEAIISWWLGPVVIGLALGNRFGPFQAASPISVWLVINAICCFISGWKIAAKEEDRVYRSAIALLIGAPLWFLNCVIALFCGCACGVFGK